MADCSLIFDYYSVWIHMFVSISKPGLEVCTTSVIIVISYEEYIYVFEVIYRLFKVYKLLFILFAR